MDRGNTSNGGGNLAIRGRVAYDEVITPTVTHAEVAGC